MMTDQINAVTIGRQFTWRRILIGAFILVGVFWHSCVHVVHDPDRSKAIEIYCSLQPLMPREQVLQILANSGLCEVSLESGGYCQLGKRFTLNYSFDNVGRLSAKYIIEHSNKRSPLPDWLDIIAWRVGLEVGPLLRKWP